MNKILSILLILLMVTCTDVLADVQSSHWLRTHSTCFILYDVQKDHIIKKLHPRRCAKRMAADSTFKIALSLIAADQKLISPRTVFHWDGTKRALPQWNHDQTPHSWLEHSAVWVSQRLTPQLGMKKIKRYLADFQYGNQDFSGDPGKHNGLTHAWLSSSLKISGDEQLSFLNRLLHHTLPVSKKAIELTRHNMFLAALPHGWSLYGKTGSGRNAQHQVEGWFVGFIERAQQRYIFVTNFTSHDKHVLVDQAGKKAKAVTLGVLGQAFLNQL